MSEYRPEWSRDQTRRVFTPSCNGMTLIEALKSDRAGTFGAAASTPESRVQAYSFTSYGRCVGGATVNTPATPTPPRGVPSLL